MKIFLRYMILPLITACVVVMSIVAFYHLGRPKDTNVTVSPRGEGTAKGSANASGIHTAEKANHNSQKDFVYPMDGTRDPFQQAPASVDTQQSPEPVVKQPAIMLTGIIWDEKSPIAILTDSENNSYLVKPGEEISKTKVLAIRPRSITIEKDGKTQELVLWPAEL